MKVGAWLSFTACGVGLLLCGCGGASAPPTPVVSPLAGNWLIVGPMPTNTLQIPPASGFKLAMTFDVTGNNIVGTGYVNAPCQLVSSPPIVLSPVSVSFATSATGTVAADGSFSVETSGNLVGSISIQGKTPQTSNGEWPGSYTASIDPSFGPACTGSFAGTVTATSFPLVSGAYVGTGSSPASLGATGKPIGFQISLQQGGIVTDPSTGLSVRSNSVLTGSIQVGGSSCFSSGMTGSTPSSSIEGSLVNAVFTMNDGSTLNVRGALTDATEESITPGVVVVTGGECAGFYQLPKLDRQS